MVRRLLLLNGLATLGVAIHHAVAYGFLAMFNWTNAYRDVTVPNYDMLGSPSYYALIIIRQLDTFAIPAFFFVSGFFVAFASGKTGRMKWEAVISRVQKFIGPFLIWTAVFFVLQINVIRSNDFGYAVKTFMRTYYYIPLIIQYYLLAPYIGPWAKKHWKTALAVTAVIQISVMSLSYFNLLNVSFPGMQTAILLTPIWFFPSRIFYFTLGLVAGFHRKMFDAWFVRRKPLLLGAFIFFAIMSFVEYQFVDNFIGERWLGPNFVGIFRTLYATTFSLTFLAFDKFKLPYEKELSKLGSMSMGVYLVNTPAIYVTSSLLYKFLPWILGIQILYAPILIVAGVAIPLLLMYLTTKLPIRNYYQYVFG